MTVADELQKLQSLYQSGAIDADEFAAAKSRLLSDQTHEQARSMVMDPATEEQQTRLWGMILHLSILAGYMVPVAGLVAPIVVWQLKKDELPGLDEHGKNAMNWIISHLIYAAIGFVLVLAVIGIPLLIALGVASVVFPIIAGLKANNGETWKYPMAITFLK